MSSSGEERSLATVLSGDLDFLAAQLHGHVGRMARADRLESLLRIPTIPDLVHALGMSGSPSTSAEFQRELDRELTHQMDRCIRHLKGPTWRLGTWIRVGLDRETFRARIRELSTARRDGNSPSIGARELNSVVELVSPEVLRTRLARALPKVPDRSQPFFLEAALDRVYLEELVARLDALPRGDLEVVRAPILWEVDQFHLALVFRGRFHYGVPPEQLLPFHVPGATLDARRFGTMLRAADLASSTIQAARLGFGEPGSPVDPVALERRFWDRLHRLALRALRADPTGFATLVGFWALRRIEARNLTTLSEAIRLGCGPEEVRFRLIPSSGERGGPC